MLMFVLNLPVLGQSKSNCRSKKILRAYFYVFKIYRNLKKIGGWEYIVTISIRYSLD
jgi:hypothetical protein